MKRKIIGIMVTASLLSNMFMLAGCDNSKDSITTEANNVSVDNTKVKSNDSQVIEKQTSNIVNTNSSKNQGQVTNTPDEKKSNELEKNRELYIKIHDYIEQTGVDHIPFQKSLIDASKKFGVPILVVLRAFISVGNEKTNLHMNDVEIDAENLQTIKENGFENKGSKWYYKGREVNVGIPITQ